MSHVPKPWLPSRLFVWESQEVTKSQRNHFFICSRVPYQSSQTPLSVGLWYTQDWPFIFKTRNLAASFCPTPWGDVMAQTFSRSSWARCGETSSTGSLNQGQWKARWCPKTRQTSQCSPGKMRFHGGWCRQSSFVIQNFLKHFDLLAMVGSGWFQVGWLKLFIHVKAGDVLPLLTQLIKWLGNQIPSGVPCWPFWLLILQVHWITYETWTNTIMW